MQKQASSRSQGFEPGERIGGDERVMFAIDLAKIAPLAEPKDAGVRPEAGNILAAQKCIADTSERQRLRDRPLHLFQAFGS
jgi:hypothetical protein